jgi:hypothetical protein
MRAQTITTISRRWRSARRRRALALALGICALAIPATALAQPSHDGYSSVNSVAPPVDTERSTQASDPSQVQAIPNAILGSDGVVEPAPATGSPAGTAGGLDWGSTAVGAGAALALIAFGGAVLLTVRRRAGVSPSASAS